MKDEEIKEQFPLYSIDRRGGISVVPGPGAEERIAELEGALRPFAKAWADRHQIYEGQAVEVNIDPEWVRYAAEVMVLDRHTDPPPTPVQRPERDWQSTLYDGAQQARCDEYGVPLDGAAKHEDSCGWPGRQAELMRPASAEMMARLNAGAQNAYTFPDRRCEPTKVANFDCSGADPAPTWGVSFVRLWRRIERAIWRGR